MTEKQLPLNFASDFRPDAQTLLISDISFWENSDEMEATKSRFALNTRTEEDAISEAIKLAGQIRSGEIDIDFCEVVPVSSEQSWWDHEIHCYDASGAVVKKIASDHLALMLITLDEHGVRVADPELGIFPD